MSISVWIFLFVGAGGITVPVSFKKKSNEVHVILEEGIMIHFFGPPVSADLL